jgi:small subunit ribosomal protein S16
VPKRSRAAAARPAFFTEKNGLPGGPWDLAGVVYLKGLDRQEPFWSAQTVAVVIRMKRMGRKNREYYRICASDRRSPRDGRVIEELGTYDPHVKETDARCTLNGPRLEHWLSVGAQPSDAVRVLIKKYGPGGTHLQQMEAARARLSMPRIVPDPGEPAFVPAPKAEPVAAESAAAAPAAEAAAEPVAEAAPAEAAAAPEPAAAAEPSAE